MSKLTVTFADDIEKYDEQRKDKQDEEVQNTKKQEGSDEVQTVPLSKQQIHREAEKLDSYTKGCQPQVYPQQEDKVRRLQHQVYPLPQQKHQQGKPEQEQLQENPTLLQQSQPVRMEQQQGLKSQEHLQPVSGSNCKPFSDLPLLGKIDEAMNEVGSFVKNTVGEGVRTLNQRINELKAKAQKLREENQILQQFLSNRARAKSLSVPLCQFTVEEPVLPLGSQPIFTTETFLKQLLQQCGQQLLQEALQPQPTSDLKSKSMQEVVHQTVQQQLVEQSAQQSSEESAEQSAQKSVQQSVQQSIQQQPTPQKLQGPVQRIPQQSVKQPVKQQLQQMVIRQQVQQCNLQFQHPVEQQTPSMSRQQQPVQTQLRQQPIPKFLPQKQPKTQLDQQFGELSISVPLKQNSEQQSACCHSVQQSLHHDNFMKHTAQRSIQQKVPRVFRQHHV